MTTQCKAIMIIIYRQMSYSCFLVYLTKEQKCGDCCFSHIFLIECKKFPNVVLGFCKCSPLNSTQNDIKTALILFFQIILIFSYNFYVTLACILCVHMHVTIYVTEFDKTSLPHTTNYSPINTRNFMVLTQKF